MNPKVSPEVTLALPVLGRKVVIQSIASALTAREWSVSAGIGQALSHAVLLTAGRGHLIHPRGQIEFAAPVLVWIPPGSADRLHLRAGSAGHLLAVADDVLASAMGAAAEAIALFHLAGRLLAAPIDRPEAVVDLRHSFLAIEREMANPAPGSWSNVTAHVTLIVVGLWRSSGVETIAGRSRGAASAILQRFRYLVELHFREHWPIPRYADALAVSGDRLHAVCIRELERPPLKLVHERLVREAMLLLERSMLTVEQISDRLGFKDPTHFNRFFKANAGKPPGAFRRDLEHMVLRGGNAATPHSFADWP